MACIGRVWDVLGCGEMPRAQREERLYPGRLGLLAPDAVLCASGYLLAAELDRRPRPFGHLLLPGGQLHAQRDAGAEGRGLHGESLKAEAAFTPSAFQRVRGRRGGTPRRLGSGYAAV